MVRTDNATFDHANGDRVALITGKFDGRKVGDALLQKHLGGTYLRPGHFDFTKHMIRKPIYKLTGLYLCSDFVLVVSAEPCGHNTLIFGCAVAGPFQD